MNRNRREFLGFAGAFAGALAFTGWTLEAFAEKAKAALKLIDMTGKTRKDAANTTAVSIAKGFKYIANVKKEKQLEGSDKTNAKGKKITLKQQKCANCSYYSEKEKGKAGTCTLIAGVLVHNDGWCKLWAPKNA